MTQHFHGVIPPVVTPLTADGQLDLSSFQRSLDRMITAGVHGVFTLGSSGEVAFSTDGRRKDIIEAVMKIVDGRVPVFVGCIDTETDRVIEHAIEAENSVPRPLSPPRLSMRWADYRRSSVTFVSFTRPCLNCRCSPMTFRCVCMSSYRMTC